MNTTISQKHKEIVDQLILRGKLAHGEFEDSDQETVDRAVTAIAWAVYSMENAKHLAGLAVKATGMGNIESKILKNRRKTIGTLSDLIAEKSVGCIESNPRKGLKIFAKPKGLVCAVTPSTNPSATPVNKAMMAVKARNSVIIATSPAANSVAVETVRLIQLELKKVGLNSNLVQVLPDGMGLSSTQYLMDQSDLVVATGDKKISHMAITSRTPAITMGTGNVPVIVSRSADITDAAKKIFRSKTFDHGISCSSESSLIVDTSVYEKTIAELKLVGFQLLTAKQRSSVIKLLWPDGKLNREFIGKDASSVARACGFSMTNPDVKAFMLEEQINNLGEPQCGEKMSVLLTILKSTDFSESQSLAQKILAQSGEGHSIGIHTADQSEVEKLGASVNVARVLVNQSHTFANGGSFDNGLNFTLSMGCGSWAGSAISENLNLTHFMNKTVVSTIIPMVEPDDTVLFKDFIEDSASANSMPVG